MTLFTRILALLLVLGVTLAAPMNAAASLLHHHVDCHQCEVQGQPDGDHGNGSASGGDHDCPCLCHVHLVPAISVAPVPVSGPRVVLVDWLAVRDALPVEGLPPGIEHPPQNA